MLNKNKECHKFQAESCTHEMKCAHSFFFFYLHNKFACTFQTVVNDCSHYENHSDGYKKSNDDNGDGPGREGLSTSVTSRSGTYCADLGSQVTADRDRGFSGQPPIEAVSLIIICST